MIQKTKIGKTNDEKYRLIRDDSTGTFYRISPQKVVTSCETYGAELTAAKWLNRR